MQISELPEHTVIIERGFFAAEFAHIFSTLGGTGHPGDPGRHIASALQ